MSLGPTKVFMKIDFETFGNHYESYTSFLLAIASTTGGFICRASIILEIC